MIPQELEEEIARTLAAADHPREKSVDVMYLLQDHYGYMSEEAVHEAARILAMTPVEVDELATFYDFIYRQQLSGSLNRQVILS